VTFAFDGEHESVGGGEADFFSDFRHTHIGGSQQQYALSEPAHQLIMSDRKIHFFAERLSERASCFPISILSVKNDFQKKEFTMSVIPVSITDIVVI